MTLSLHSVCTPMFVRTLTAMLGWLDKAEAHARERGFDPQNYLGLRLAPDMLPFTRQIQIASDGVKGCMARLSGQEPPKWEDTEASMDELRARIHKTLDYVNSMPAAAFEGAEQREIVLAMRHGDPLRFAAPAYVQHYVLPNLYFHASMTYALLRHAGVALGKRDFLGN